MTESRIFATVVVAALIAATTPCMANDSSAELAAGGLVLTKNDAIEMESENLYISDKLVRVNYRFKNTSPKDVTVTVAFPLPDVTIDGPEENPVIPKDDSANFLAFT